MAIFSLEDGSRAAYSLEDAPKALQDARVATGEENNPTPSYTTLHHTTQQEERGSNDNIDNLRGNQLPAAPKGNNTTHREAKGKRREATGEVILLIILCQDLATANRALDIIQRDLGSQLLQIEQCDTVVGAYLSTLQGFNPSECLSFYHYHLNRSLGHQAQVWITTKGGEL